MRTEMELKKNNGSSGARPTTSRTCLQSTAVLKNCSHYPVNLHLDNRHSFCRGMGGQVDV
jgi:hypothetical protein